MRSLKSFVLSLAVLLYCSFLAASGIGADKQETIRAARQSYYNLPSHGFVEFQCSVVPNWTAILKEELKTDIPPDHPGLNLLNRIHFWLSWDQKGSAKLTHQSDYTPVDQKSMEGLNQTISGIEEVLTGFSQTMSSFLFTSPFPKVDGDYQLAEQPDGYRLFYREGRFDVQTTMRKDFAILELKVTGAEFIGTIKPQVTKTDFGFLVTGYQGNYQPSSGGSSMQVSAQLDYKDVSGFQLPDKLRVDTSAGGSTHKIELQFTDYQVKKL